MQKIASAFTANGTHPRLKLTDHEIELVRQSHADGMSTVQLARLFDVSRVYVWRVVNYLRRCP